MSTQHLSSLAWLSADFQVGHAALLEIVEAEGIHPTLVLNGLRYFDPSAVERIHAVLMARTNEQDANAGTLPEKKTP